LSQQLGTSRSRSASSRCEPKGLSDLRGGVGQGIEVTTAADANGNVQISDAKTIPGKGGFVQVQVDPIAWYSLQLGPGVDNPRGVDPGNGTPASLLSLRAPSSSPAPRAVTGRARAVFGGSGAGRSRPVAAWGTLGMAAAFSGWDPEG
jgi:hypothetical protein